MEGAKACLPADLTSQASAWPSWSLASVGKSSALSSRPEARTHLHQSPWGICRGGSFADLIQALDLGRDLHLRQVRSHSGCSLWPWGAMPPQWEWWGE